MSQVHLSFLPDEEEQHHRNPVSAMEIMRRQEAARRRKIFRSVKLFLDELKADGGIVTPFSQVRGLGDGNQFLKRGPGKTPKSHGGSPPFEYTVVEMLADLTTHLERREIEKVTPLFLTLQRILKR